ncbi:ArsR/SmtB family transcription factor [Kitasatospora sp. NPDC093550]|uniref:ArsR/SmtB family transcription factor n=1 Tax=Kitasatospora sp. NPDC093550 TaxID=3364089 RepID=UPI0038098358
MAAAARQLDHPEVTAISLAEVLHALSDPHRLSVVRDLAAAAPAAVACGELDLPVSRSTYTHHFRVLRESGLIRQRYQGTSILNQLRRDELESRFPGLLDSVLLAADRERGGH